jgi:hypothetical protein
MAIATYFPPKSPSAHKYDEAIKELDAAGFLRHRHCHGRSRFVFWS